MNPVESAPPLRLLLLEASPADGEQITTVLRETGLSCAVERVSDQASYEQALARGPFAAILADFAVPGYDGLAALARARQQCPTVPFLFVSGVMGERPAIEALRQGAADYVAKDNLGQLGPAVLGALRKAHERAERERTEEAMRQSEARFAKAFQSNPAAMCISTVKDGRLIEVNGRYCQCFGLRAEELIGRTTVELELWANPADRALLIERLQAQGFVRDYEIRFRRKGGELLDALLSMERIDFPGEREPVAVSMFSDITGRKRAEAVLRRDSEKEVQQRQSKVTRELAAIVVLGLVLFTVEYNFDLSEPVIEWVWKHRETPVDETLFTLVLFGPLLGLFAYRRWRETRIGIFKHQEAEAALRLLHHELDERVRQRTAELNTTNVALRQAEAKFRGIFENAVEGILQTTPDGRILTANPAFARMLGYESVAALLSAALFLDRDVYVNPEDRIHFLRLMEEHGVCNDFQCQIKRQDGQAIWVSFNARPARDAAGMIQSYDAICVDITERKRAEQQLREQAALLDLTADAIIVRDLTQRVTYWNKGAESLYGWTAAEAVGQVSTELYATIPWEGREAAHEQVLEQGGWQGELHQKHKTGMELAVQSRWTLLRNGEGAPHAVLVINSDITEKKQLAEQFLRAQRMESIGSLAGGIAHDLNNALAPILMASELLKMTNTDADKGRMLDTIYESAQRGAGMVKQILTFARGSEGDRGTVQPKHLVKEMIDIARHTFPKTIQIRTDVATETWTLVGNPTQLHQILLNLCVNARDAMPKGGTLTLATGNVRLDADCTMLSPDARPGPHVLLTVTDTGEGMPPEVQARIFDAFFTTKEPGKGTGLGLSTVLSIAKEHGGFLTVDSAVGRGTTFRVYLPAQETTAAPAEAAAPPALPMGHGELILVVDDEAAIRSIATQTLQAYGYRTLAASDGAQAVGVCAQNLAEVKLLLTDMAMPIMDGKATIRAIRTLLPRLPVLVASGSSSPPDSPAFKELNVQAFLHKPYSADELVRTVHEVLHGGGIA